MPDDHPLPAADRIDSPADLDASSPFTLPGFFAALADERVLGSVCRDCAGIHVPPRPTCPDCGGRDVVAEDQPRTGRVVSHTEVRVPPAAFADEAPYTVAVVELDSGARLTGRVDAPYDAVAIEDRVSLAVRDPTPGLRKASLDIEADWPLHVFEPVGE